MAPVTLGAYVEKPFDNYLVSSKRPLWHLKETVPWITKLSTGQGYQFSVYYYASWAGEHKLKKRSRTRILLKFEEEVINTTSQNQKCISLSSMKLEYIALSATCKIICRLRRLLEELGELQNETITWQDNSGAIEWANGGAARYLQMEACQCSL